jgi:hypothetical protein
VAKPGNLIFNFNEGVSGSSFPVSSSKSCSKSWSLEAAAASNCSWVSAKANAFVLGFGALLFLAPPDSSALKSVSEKREKKIVKTQLLKLDHLFPKKFE